MPKRIANGLTLLSAVVCVGSALLVGRSFFLSDVLEVSVWKSRGCRAVAIGGILVLDDMPYSPGLRYRTRSAARIGKQHDALWRSSEGIRWLSLGWRAGEWLILPLWLLSLLTAIPPVRWWRARRRGGGRGFAVEGGGPGGARE